MPSLAEASHLGSFGMAQISALDAPRAGIRRAVSYFPARPNLELAVLPRGRRGRGLPASCPPPDHHLVRQAAAGEGCLNENKHDAIDWSRSYSAANRERKARLRALGESRDPHSPRLLAKHSVSASRRRSTGTATSPARSRLGWPGISEIKAGFQRDFGTRTHARVSKASAPRRQRAKRKHCLLCQSWRI
jgi:hypothetical protein